VALLMPVLCGVATAHDQGVIHRDLKPDNIFLCTGPDGDARDCKVLDFGISKVAADDQRDLGMTQSGTVMGTPYYMSPEQIRGLKEVDQRGDVYAFGVILYEMLADCYPYDADTYNALIVKIATSEPTPLQCVRPDLDRGLSAVVMKAMARDREQRHQSVAELGLALERFAGNATFRSTTASRSVRPASSANMQIPGIPRLRAQFARGGRPRAAVIAAALLLALLASSLVWNTRAPSFSAEAPPVAEEFRVQPRPLQTHAAALEVAPEPPASPRHQLPAPPSARPASPRKQGPASLRVPAPHTQNVAAPAPTPRPEATPALPSDWDERIPPGLPAPAGHPPRPEPASSGPNGAGQLSAEDL
jgi:eukaryotic-like serine/threonine-protein kinase